MDIFTQKLTNLIERKTAEMQPPPKRTKKAVAAPAQHLNTATLSTVMANHDGGGDSSIN